MQISDSINISVFNDNTVTVTDKNGKNTESVQIQQKEKPIKRKNDTVNFSQNAQSLIEQFHNSEENAEKTAEGFEEFIQCLTIASRIMSGDKVPYSDQKFLQEKNPDLFFKASMLRQQKNNPKEYESVLSDEENENSTDEISAEQLDSVMENSSSNTSDSSSDEISQ